MAIVRCPGGGGWDSQAKATATMANGAWTIPWTRLDPPPPLPAIPVSQHVSRLYRAKYTVKCLVGWVPSPSTRVIDQAQDVEPMPS
jgi:hypothetical protein